MKEFTKEIIEVLSQVGIEKIKEAGSVEALVAMIKEYGVETSPEEVQAALEEIMQAADGRQELNEDSLDSVAGGNPAALIPLIPTVIDGITTVVKKIKGDPKKPESTPAAPATTTAPQGPTVQQTTTNNKNMVNNNNVNGANTSNNISFA